MWKRDEKRISNLIHTLSFYVFGNKIKETKGKKEQKRKRKGRYIIKDVVWWCCIETIYKNKRERSLLVIYFQLIPSSPLSLCLSIGFLKNTREWKLVYKKLDWFARALSVNECKSKGIKKEETTSSNGHSLCCAWPLCRESEREKRRSAIKERDFVVRVDERSSSLLESKGGTTLPSGIIVSPKSRRSKKNHPNRRKNTHKKVAAVNYPLPEASCYSSVASIRKKRIK